MYTKQEKLAAARKKLKEFQGKQRENESNKTKNVLPGGVDIDKSSTQSPSNANLLSSNLNFYDTEHINSGNSCSPNPSDSLDHRIENKLKANVIQGYDSINISDSEHSKFPVFTFNQDNSNDFSSLNISETPTNSEVLNKDLATIGQFAVITDQSKHANGLYDSEVISQSKPSPSICPEDSKCDNLNSESITKESGKIISQETSHNYGTQASNSNAHKNNPYSSSIPNEAFSQSVLPNTELFTSSTSHLSVPQLIEERNNLLQVLRKTEEYLKYKTDQVESMSQTISFLQTRVKDLEGNILSANHESQSLRVKNENLTLENEGNKTFMEQFKKKFDSREEQLSELQQKLELKTSECEKLGLKLEEVQMQLSSSLIKIQQLSIGESPAFTATVSNLQNENSDLSQRINELEKNLESLNAEREQSSHNFHTYAQQCNNQLASLSAEIRNLTKENQFLLEKNNLLSKNLKELENQNVESKPEQENEVLTDLTHKLHLLSEENLSLQAQLNQKMEQIQAFEKENVEKMEVIKEMEVIIEEIRSENVKLLEEREGVSNNQKLLAAMESDKVAAARAVAQNHKLKEQLTELEEGFIKLSHEKLQLADELAHEKHLKKELELKIKELISNQEADSRSKPVDVMINESADVEELRAIIRQLEDDKTELLFRLNANNSSKVSNEVRKEEEENAQNDHNKSDGISECEEESEDTKTILQKMEEKVKKTMNEIAALDEEKEKLEHLVLQLQGETETIGEYISIYQTQRMLLRQRNKEKDDQLLQLTKDKEELKTKLVTLNDLVHHLLNEKGNDGKQIPVLKEDEEPLQSSEEPALDTAVRIQALISEIQSTNLIDNQRVAFEHCPCCSGRLIVI